ncbi:hypothetical protein [Caballeronia sp. J97]|uniref:hypothetical protein n=1 Tax=Caballeronia sp. J97 TaxID=2805429 RepID=UPI002AB07F15|nr:hypothetical protein [Caballeronia sp. J97]
MLMHLHERDIGLPNQLPTSFGGSRVLARYNRAPVFDAMHQPATTRLSVDFCAAMLHRLRKAAS